MKAVFLVVSLLLPLSYSVASAQLAKVTVGTVQSPQAIFPPGWPKKPGIFRKNGLDMQLVYFRGRTPAMMALLSGETPITQLGGPAIVSAIRLLKKLICFIALDDFASTNRKSRVRLSSFARRASEIL